jgi:DNA-binding MarR family transcriptional regulator
MDLMSLNSPPPSLLEQPPAETEWRSRFVQDLETVGLVDGASRAVLRVLAWLAVCEPREQRAAEIQDALSLSAGTVSVALRMLDEAGLVQRVTRPGDRQVYNRIDPQAWLRALEARVAALTAAGTIAARAIAASDGGADSRLFELRDLCAVVDDTMTRLVGSDTDGSEAPSPTPIRG